MPLRCCKLASPPRMSGSRRTIKCPPRSRTSTSPAIELRTTSDSAAPTPPLLQTCFDSAIRLAEYGAQILKHTFIEEQYKKPNLCELSRQKSRVRAGPATGTLHRNIKDEYFA